MTLPKWVEEAKKESKNVFEIRLVQALAIAVEALEKGRNWDGPSSVVHGLNGEALSQIEKLGER